MDDSHIQRVPLRRNPLGQGLILVTTAMLGVGVVWAVSTAGGREAPEKWYYRLDARQAIFATVGFLIIATLWRLDYRLLARRAFADGRFWKWLLNPSMLLLLVGVGLSALVLVLNQRTKGSARWLRWGPIGIQPSEILKFTLMIYLAAFLGWLGPRVRTFWACFLPSALLIAVGCGLIVTQDFGTAAILGAGAMALLIMGGVRLWHLLLIPPAAAGVFYKFVYCVPYRRARIAAMFEPFSSTLPSVYQSKQSEIAVASGLQPAGIGGGMAKHGYLPEAQPDFIFSLICQEAGILGGALVVGLLLACLLLTWRIARNAADRFGALLAAGLGVLVAVQAVLHIAVTVRWAPATGVPLPFISYGGTGLILTAMATTLIVSVSARRRVTDLGDTEGAD